jgi:queuine tRNA-ribosyltransferase
VSAFAFSIDASEGRARVGRLRLTHGEVRTPAFMPVGTQGAVKAVSPGELRACGAEIVLANTYHLFLRPGHEVVAELGGLRRFMGWDGPILTDSGGFQVFSLASLARVDEDGVEFRSHLDGSAQRLTPERSMEVQAALGSDVAMVLDVCPPATAAKEEIAAAVERTTRWARRSKESYHGAGVAFGIVQGGTHADLREASAAAIRELDFAGYAIGGVSVGEPEGAIDQATRLTTPLLPDDRPRYLMGVGRPRDLVLAVDAGVDLFDCVMPTRNARNGFLFTSQGAVRIKRSEHRRDPAPLDRACPCEACTRFSRAYLRHLFVSGEILAARLHTMHNLTYYFGLMRRMREAIAEGTFAGFRDAFLASPEAVSVVEEPAD